MSLGLNNYVFFYQIPASPFAEGLVDLTAVLLFYFIVLVVFICWFFFRFIMIFTWMGSSINYVWILFDNQEVIGWLADMTSFLGGSQEIIVLLEEDSNLQECNELSLEISNIENYSLCNNCTFVGIWDSYNIYFFSYDITQLSLFFVFGWGYNLWFVNEFAFLFFLAPLELIIFYYKYYSFSFEYINNDLVLSELNMDINFTTRSPSYVQNWLEFFAYGSDLNLFDLLGLIFTHENLSSFSNFILFFASWINYCYFRAFGGVLAVYESYWALIDIFVYSKLLGLNESVYLKNPYSRKVESFYENSTRKYSYIIVASVTNLFVSNSVNILPGLLGYSFSAWDYKEDIFFMGDSSSEGNLRFLSCDLWVTSNSLALYYYHFFYNFCEISELWDNFYNDHVMLNNNLFLRSERITHNVEAELCWTFIPVLFLIGMGIPSMGYLYFEDGFYINPIMSINVTGNQWYWTYQYNMLFAMKNEFESPFFNNVESLMGSSRLDSIYNHNADASSPGLEVISEVFKNVEEFGVYASSYNEYSVASFYDISFNSNMVSESDLRLGCLRLLEVDQSLILPISAMVSLGVTSVDVIHCWAVPSLGKKLDGLPGRLNVSSIYISIPGVYYGQCSEICGVDHAFMPIVVEGVESIFFMRWLEFMKSLCNGDFEGGYNKFSPNISVRIDDDMVSIPVGVDSVWGVDNDENRLVLRYSYTEDLSIPW